MSEMSMYSLEDKQFIELFASQNSLDTLSMEHEEKWQELGVLMNRDWHDIRKMYQNWKIPGSSSQSESTSELENHQTNECHNNSNLEQLLSANHASDIHNVVEYVNIDGQLIQVDQLLYTSNVQPQPITCTIENPEPSSSLKRPFDVLGAEVNSDLVKIFENQTRQELELKRQEHEEKMMIYRQQLIQGEEVHKERMKILRAKLRAIEEKVENIDSVISNNNAKKKFKSGSI